jgi:hypothetical protein
LPSLPPDSPLDDAADSNRLTSRLVPHGPVGAAGPVFSTRISRFRPKFWWKDLDDEEGMYMICLQALSGGFLLAPAPSVC